MKFVFNVKYLWSFYETRCGVPVLYEGISVIEAATPERIATLFKDRHIMMIQVQGQIYGCNMGPWSNNYVGTLEEYILPHASDYPEDRELYY